VSRARVLAWLAAAAALAVYVALELRVGTDITRFMPDRAGSELAALSTQLTDSPFTRTMVFSIGAPDLDAAVAVAGTLARELRAHPGFAWVRAGLEDEQMRGVYELYFPRRYGFVSAEPEHEIPALVSEAALRERARLVRRRLASPAGAQLEELVAADPIGAFERIALRFRGDEVRLSTRGGQLVTADGRYAILLAATRDSAFASGAQARLLADVDAAFRSAAAAVGTDATLESSGANRFAVSVERRMKRDVYVIGAVTFLGVAALFLGLVGSMRAFVLVAVPPLLGILAATAACLARFGGIDGLTMAFGATLLGVTIDYSTHVLVHHGLSGHGESAWATARRLRASLVLAAATTVASLGGMGATAFPAFREMSFFAAVGVAVALLATLFLVPDLLAWLPRLPERAARTARALERAQRALLSAPRALLFAPVAAAALGVLLLPRLQWVDDMSRLARFDPDLAAEDARVRERVGAADGGHFAIGVAGDAAAALELNDAIHARLVAVRDAGGFERLRSLHSLLWSEPLQRRNQAALRAEPDLPARVEAAFAAEGFRPGSFAPFEQALAEPPPPPLTLADLEGGPLSDLPAAYVFPLGERVAVVSYLEGMREPERVASALAGLPGAHLLDQRSFVSDIYSEFRETTLEQLAAGCLLVVLLVALRYRAWRPSLAAFLPSLAVALLLLAGFAAAGIELNLMHVMSLAMVMGLSVDYGVYLVDSAGDPEELGATLLSLLVSGLSTAFVFGALAISEQPALRAIGVTTGLGVLLSYALAPILLVAFGLRSREGA
jgi:predicted exporter